MILAVAPYRSIPVTVRFNMIQDIGSLLHAPGELVTADHPFELSTRPVPEAPTEYTGRETGNAPDIFAARLVARNYRVSSLLTLVSTSVLQASNSAYPDWVEERYLALPEKLSDRVLGLVLELTGGMEKPYEKALAIETYLRTIPYSLDIPAPDPFVDVVDYFLFDLKKGYCDYYATAMVVMARAAGVPSRLAVGYASGSYDRINRRFVVTEADAHSWVEVYFQGIGWVEFEPTASLPGIQRPAEDPSQLSSTTIPAPLNRPGLPSLQELMSWGILAFIVIGSFILAWNTLEAFRLRRLGVEKGFRNIFKQLYHHSRPLTGTIQAGCTPLEFSENLRGKLQAEFLIPGWKENLTVTTSHLNNLTQKYNLVLYSSHALEYTDLKLAWQQWRQLRNRLWLARLGRKIEWIKKAKQLKIKIKNRRK
jgi:transglutaminase-like putative cysteine protease